MPGTASAQSTAAEWRARQEASVAQQQQSIAARMSTSLETQQVSVRRQIEPSPREPAADSFFILRSSLDSSAEPPPEFDCEPISILRRGSLVDKAAHAEGVSAPLLNAMIAQESGFNPCAVSPKGALGLMQLMPATADQFGVRDPFDPEENINAGAKFLKTLLNRYGGDLNRALGAYNAAPKRVDAADGVPPIAETLNYVRSILQQVQVKELNLPAPLAPLEPE